VESLKPNNSDTKAASFRTDEEILLEKKLQTYRQRMIEFVRDQLAYAQWQRKTEVRISRWKWLMSRQKIKARENAMKQMLQFLRKVDEELLNMKK
jgi:hypothetical protein